MMTLLGAGPGVDRAPGTLLFSGIANPHASSWVAVGTTLSQVGNKVYAADALALISLSINGINLAGGSFNFSGSFGNIASLAITNCGITGTLDLSALGNYTTLDVSANSLTGLTILLGGGSIVSLNASDNDLAQASTDGILVAMDAGAGNNTVTINLGGVNNYYPSSTGLAAANDLTNNYGATITLPSAPSVPAIGAVTGTSATTLKAVVTTPLPAGTISLNLYDNGTLAVTGYVNGADYGGASDQQSHTMTVTAVGPGGESTPSSGVAGACLPNAPVINSFAGVNYDGTQLNLAYQMTGLSPLAVSVQPYFGTATNPPVSGAPLADNASPVNFTGLTPGATYYANLAIIDSFGQLSAKAAEVSTTTALPPLPNFQVSYDGIVTDTGTFNASVLDYSFIWDTNTPPVANPFNALSFTNTVIGSGTVYYLVAVDQSGVSSEIATATSS